MTNYLFHLHNRFEVIRIEENPPTRDDIFAKLPGIDALFWCSKYRLDKEVLDRAGKQIYMKMNKCEGCLLYICRPTASCCEQHVCWR